MKRIRDSHPTRQQVHELFRTAVLTVCRVDSDLFSLGAHEQALTFRIGRNLANMIEHPNSKLRVDAEYNQTEQTSKNYPQHRSRRGEARLTDSCPRNQ